MSGKPNTRGGKNYKRTKTNRVKKIYHESKIDVENGEGYYGKVLRFYGGDQIFCNLHDGRQERAKIPGRMMGFRTKINVGDTVLINLDMEVVELIKAANSRIEEADSKLRGNTLFQNQEDIDESNDDIDDKLMNISSTAAPELPIDKTKKMTMFKEKEKERDKHRKTLEGRQFTDPKILEAQLEDLNIDDI